MESRESVTVRKQNNKSNKRCAVLCIGQETIVWVPILPPKYGYWIYVIPVRILADLFFSRN